MYETMLKKKIIPALFLNDFDRV